MLTGVHERTVFPGIEELEVSGGVSSTDGKVLRWSKSVLLATATSSESVNSWFNPVQMARILTCLHGRTVFPDVEESCCLWVSGRASSMGVKVSRWSQTVLCGTTLGSECLYSWSDTVQMARMLTGVYGRTVFQVLKKPVVRSRVSSQNGKVLKWSQSALLATAVR